MRIPREDPLVAPSAVKRFATMAANSDTGMRCAAWYLKNVVPRIEPATKSLERRKGDVVAYHSGRIRPHERREDE